MKTCSFFIAKGIDLSAGSGVVAVCGGSCLQALALRLAPTYDDLVNTTATAEFVARLKRNYVIHWSVIEFRDRVARAPC